MTLQAGVAQLVCQTTDWTTGVRSLLDWRDFSSSLCVQTSSEVHPASCPMDAAVISRGVKRGRGVMLTAHSQLVSRSRMSWIYIPSHPWRLHGVAGELYLIWNYIKYNEWNKFLSKLNLVVWDFLFLILSVLKYRVNWCWNPCIYSCYVLG
jgi:hypothetical protein